MSNWRNLLFGALPEKTRTEDRARLEHELAMAYRPLLRLMMLPLAIYYGAVVALRLVTETGPAMHVMVALALIGCVCFIHLFFNYLPRAETLKQVELAGAAVFVLTYVPTVVNQMLNDEPNKYFLFAAIALALSAAGVTPRVIFASVALSLATLLGLVFMRAPELTEQYLILTMGVAVGAISIASLMRGAIAREIRARFAAEDLREKAEILADHDGLTGLPNRRRFFAELENMLASHGDQPHSFALASIDLDAFRPVNDLYGHATGDEVLIEASRRVQAICADTDFAGRLGGDEFAVLIKGPRSVHQLQDFGKRIRAALSEPFEPGGAVIWISASVGMVRHPKSGATSRDLFEQADYALYKARREGSDGVEVFTRAFEREMINIGVVDHALRNCDLEEELYLEYQPQFDVTSHTVIGFEALARWNSAKLGRVGPGVFIVAAERCAMIEQLTEVLLKKALATAADWPNHIRIAFNLSARDVISATSLAAICTIVRESGIDPGRITFEITETSIVSDVDMASQALQTLRDLGARVALDDFGSGYSNFGHIDQLPLNEIKVDRSFVLRLTGGGNTPNIVKTIIGMCANLGLECIVEGVETTEELQIVKRLGAQYVQGFLLGKPIGRHEIADFLANAATPARRRA